MARPRASNVPTIPPCNGRYIAEGFTYRLRDPHRGEMVVIHARVDPSGTVTPDPHARDLNLLVVRVQEPLQLLARLDP